MGKRKSRPLSHAEIWDDSALLQSWAEALNEYKKYHSIDARGENIEEVIQAAEANNQNPDSNLGNEADKYRSEQLEDLEDGELEEEVNLKNGDLPEDRTSHRSEGDDSVPSTQSKPQTAVPAAMMNTVKDEALKNLMMSWYYAGYYTGFYESQKSTDKATGDE